MTYPVFDLHQDVLSRLLKDGEGAFDGGGERVAQVNLDRLAAGSYRAALWALFLPDARGPEGPAARAIRMVGIALSLAEAHRDRMALCLTPAAATDGRFAAMLSVENGSCLEGSIEVLRVLAHLGVVSFGLVWNGRNEIGDGAVLGTDAGLTPFGRRVVAECGRLGVAVDVSHLNVRGFREVMDLAEGPVIASHSNCRAVRDHPRNLTDEQVRALAARGGVMGLNLCPAFLVDGPRAGIGDVVAHALHAAEVAGGARVLALGTDYDGIESTPEGLEDPSRIQALAGALLAAGFSEDEVRGVFLANALRALSGRPG